MEDLEQVAQRVLGRQGRARIEPVKGGYTPAERGVVRFADGSSVFCKRGTDDWTSEHLRSEHRVYLALEGKPFLPQVLGWDEGGPTLILEDLSNGRWPPPWLPGDVDRVLATLRRLHATQVPQGAIPDHPPEELDQIGRGWHLVQEHPGPFLGLGLASETWLSENVEALARAEAQAQLGGHDLAHLDIRSDNICFLGDRVVFVDWDKACRANGNLDVAAWLPSVRLEGGPEPDEVLDEPSLAAAISGWWAYQAGLPLEDLPRVRWIQREQLTIALPWAARALNLREPG